MVHISIEGNIGCGKSSVLAALSNASGGDAWIVPFPEPVASWVAPVLSDGRSMLQAFYDAPARNAFAFQMYVLASRREQMTDVVAVQRRDSCVAVTERCLASDANIFARTMHTSGLMTEEEWVTYTAWGEKDAGDLPDAVVYVKCDPRVALARTLSRAREGELAIDLAYLTRIHDAHEDWIASLSEDTGRDRPVVVMTLDGNMQGEAAVASHARRIQALASRLARCEL